MKIDILSLFPGFTEYFTNVSIISRAVDADLLDINSINIRDYSKNKHNKVDDYPYGGGPGMVLTPQPVIEAIIDVSTNESYVINMSPRGKKFDQNLAKELSYKDHLILLCGHYEGIDQRVIDNYVDLEISIGDFILTGGELPAMVIVDAVARLLPEVLGNKESSEIESFENYLLEYDQYTRPQNYKGLEVPDILLSGNHQLIEEYRLKNSIEITKKRRPDLYKLYKKS